MGVALDRKLASPRVLLGAGALLLTAYTLLLAYASAPPAGVLTGLIKGLADATVGIAIPFAHTEIFGREFFGSIFSVNRSVAVCGAGEELPTGRTSCLLSKPHMLTLHGPV